MIDIDARISIEIEGKNYEQVVKNDKGRFLGTMVKVPKLNSFIRNKVDQTIEEEVKENLKQELPENLAKVNEELGKKGVQASVNVSLTY